MKKILIGGGTGLIGKALSKKLSEEGYIVNILTRDPDKKSSYNLFYWDPLQNKIDQNAFAGVNRIINLTGENISKKRWTNNQRAILEKSRVLSTNLLRKNIKELKLNLKSYISSSAIGYYGTFNSDKILKENDSPGDDYLATVCLKWENAVNKIKEEGINTVILRTGVVFSKHDGAFPKMIQTLKNNNLVILGNGNQYIPWIHIDDIVSMFLHVLNKDELSGVFNAVGPISYKQKSIIKKVKEYSDKKVLITKIPGFIVKLIFGEMSSILLYGSRISSEKIERSEFEFKYRRFEEALTDLI